jgi:hypothetical protein
LFAGLSFPNSPSAATEEYDGSSWSGGGSMSLARYAIAGCGTQTAGLCFGGDAPTTGATEEYDGATWSPSNPLNTARSYVAGAGTQTAGLALVVVLV